jgi:putative transposase
MARPLRIDVPGGWYHITARGQNRRPIFDDGRDHEEFLCRLEEMTKRFGVELHAYVLMPNHYHLLVRCPKANGSRAMQWLNNGYAMWRNRRHRTVGHVFQGRFKAILVEEGQWVLALSHYLHFNPVAVRGLGLGKAEKKAERMGLVAPPAQTVKARLAVLRSYPWSSYGAYAGYRRAPAWLTTSEVLGRVRGGRAGYRHEAEDRLGGGQREKIWSRLRWGVVLGAEKFAEAARRRAVVVRETQGRRALRRETSWGEIVKAVEAVKGEEWSRFAERYGDWGRDLALWIGRRRGGMTLRELGAKAGGMDYSAVSEAIRAFERVYLQRAAVRRAQKSVCHYLSLET